MNYANNYLNATKIASTIRESATKGKTRSGLAARREQENLVEADFSVGTYMEDMKKLFEDQKPKQQDFSVTGALVDMEAPTEQAPETSFRPVTSLEGLAGESGLDQNPEFMAAIENLESKYPGLDRREIFRIIKGESNFNPQAVNEDTSAAGLFQFTPDAASDLGYSTEEILSMSPAEQVAVYDEYLESWDYNPENSLGIMQAAPAYAKTRGGDDVVYEKGSEAWEANPGWRSEGDGPITVESLNRYYRGS
jgi:soluble lytic murein transglycosylase-like protein